MPQLKDKAQDNDWWIKITIILNYLCAMYQKIKEKLDRKKKKQNKLSLKILITESDVQRLNCINLYNGVKKFRKNLGSIVRGIFSGHVEFEMRPEVMK